MNDLKLVDAVMSGETLTMSSLEIAELSDKQHKHVLVDIDNMLKELDIDSAEISAQYKDSSGKSNRLFNLPKRECTILTSGYDIKFRAKIIDRWFELEAVVKPKPLTPMEIVLAQSTAIVKIEQEQALLNAKLPGLEHEVSELKERADHTDHLFHLGDHISLKAYFNVHKVKMDTTRAAAVGRECTRLCKQDGIKIGKVPCPIYGQVNTYPIYVIEQVLNHD